jgi:hypothetical protein
MIFMITFGQYHPLRNHWIEIEAIDAEAARMKSFDQFGPKWAFLYAAKDFNPSYFPGGKVGETLR